MLPHFKLSQDFARPQMKSSDSDLPGNWFPNGWNLNEWLLMFFTPGLTEVPKMLRGGAFQHLQIFNWNNLKYPNNLVLWPHSVSCFVLFCVLADTEQLPPGVVFRESGFPWSRPSRLSPSGFFLLSWPFLKPLALSWCPLNTRVKSTKPVCSMPRPSSWRYKGFRGNNWDLLSTVPSVVYCRFGQISFSYMINRC